MPGIFGLLGTSFYVLGDTLIVGQALGRAGLASLNLSIPMINFMQGIGLLLGFGGSTALSRALGRGAKKRAKEWAEKTITWSIILGFLLLFLLRLFFKPLLLLLTGGGPALAGAEAYLGILFYFSPAYVIFQSLVVLLRNDGAAKLAMLSLLLCSGLNVALDALFLFVFDWGMYGAGLATGLAQLAGLILALTHLRKADLLKDLSPRPRPPFRLMAKGMASFVMELSQGVVIFTFNTVLLSLQGELAVSSYAIIANLSLIFTAIFLGLAQGAQPLLARAHGAGNKEEFMEILRFGQELSFLLSALVLGLCLLAPRLLSSIFISGDPELLDMTVGGLRIYALGFVFLAYNLIGTIALQSSAKSREAFSFALVRGMLLLILYLLLLQKFFGLYGVWFAFFLTELTGFIWLQRILRRDFAELKSPRFRRCG
ncbi:MAG: MATE family efflux transporter [Eubacteriales bacterium]|nr:MATE family efflux transporter [Eubacteriales bacterium]